MIYYSVMLLSILLVSGILPLLSGTPLEQPFDYSNKDDNSNGKIWALLASGGDSYSDYGLESNVCHAYQVLHTLGIPDDNIILMMSDDIAYNSENPHQGKIFNKPGGPNVYKNVLKDYTGSDVTVQNFINIITGNSTGLRGTGSGKVFKSGPNDHVFIYLSGRGAYGYAAFPDDFLAASDFINAVKTMYSKRMYKQLLIYMDISYAGSMFYGLLPENITALAISASLPEEVTYFIYDDSDVGAYLATIFSASFLENLDKVIRKKKINLETLKEQYKIVANRTKDYSTVTSYGTEKIMKEHITTFFGNGSKGEIAVNVDSQTYILDAVTSEDAYINLLKRKIDEKRNQKEKQTLQNKLESLLKDRQEIDQLFNRIISQIPNLDVKSINNNQPKLTGDRWSCYKTVVDAFNKQCVNIVKNKYILKHLYKFANICNSEVISLNDILKALDNECEVPKNIFGIH